MKSGFEIVPIRVSETCQNLSGHVKCPCMVIRWTCPFFATRLTGVTRRDAPSRYKSRQCISCWRAARCSWSRSLIPPCSRCCWTIIRGFHTIAGGTEHAVGTRLVAVFPILQRLVHADFAAVEIVETFYAQCWSCF